jgi:hypothetical protein
MCFMPVTDPKTVKNRIQPDLTSSAQDREQQTERLPALGHAWSTPADLLADPRKRVLRDTPERSAHPLSLGVGSHT